MTTTFPQTGPFNVPRTARALCLGLGVFDAALGGAATFLPHTYASVFHPHAADRPVDLIVRTGLLWLFFSATEFWASRSEKPAPWFCLVGMLRLMDVLPDLAYGTLAAGATWLSRTLIYSAPFFNLVSGIYLLRTGRQLMNR